MLLADSDNAFAAVKGVAHCTSVRLHDLNWSLESTGMMVKQSECILLHASVLALLLQVECWRLECLTAGAIAVLQLLQRIRATVLICRQLRPSGANWQVMYVFLYLN